MVPCFVKYVRKYQFSMKLLFSENELRFLLIPNTHNFFCINVTITNDVILEMSIPIH